MTFQPAFIVETAAVAGDRDGHRAACALVFDCQEVLMEVPPEILTGAESLAYIDAWNAAYTSALFEHRRGRLKRPGVLPLVRGGQGRPDGSLLETLRLLVFCTVAGVILLAMALWLNGCACDTPEHRLTELKQGNR